MGKCPAGCQAEEPDCPACQDKSIRAGSRMRSLQKTVLFRIIADADALQRFGEYLFIRIKIVAERLKRRVIVAQLHIDITEQDKGIFRQHKNSFLRRCGARLLYKVFLPQKRESAAAGGTCGSQRRLSGADTVQA